MDFSTLNLFDVSAYLGVNSQFLALGSVVLGILIFCTITAQLILWYFGPSKTMDNVQERIAAWWGIAGLGIIGIGFGMGATTVLFALVSFFCLREFISITPTVPEDRWALVSLFYVGLPVQFYCVYVGWYGLFSILLPVYGFFILSALPTLHQESRHFLERAAKIQWGAMVCVYGISHLPALLTLDLTPYGHSSQSLLLYFIVVVQMSDVFQYLCGKLFGKHKVAPVLSPNKTWEGLIGGAILSVALAAYLRDFTPFSLWQSIAFGIVMVLAGFFGGLILSAVKRSLGAKDWGVSLPGHGGMLDRLDSLAFSAPLFFHLVRYNFA